MERLKPHIRSGENLNLLTMIAVECMRLLVKFYSIVSPIAEIRQTELSLVNESFQKELEKEIDREIENIPDVQNYQETEQNDKGGENEGEEIEHELEDELEQNEYFTTNEPRDETMIRLASENERLKVVVSQLLQRIEALEMSNAPRPIEKNLHIKETNSTRVNTKETPNIKLQPVKSPINQDFCDWLKERCSSLESFENNFRPKSTHVDAVHAGEEVDVHVKRESHLPIHKWTLRYDGMDNGRKLNEFLKEVEFNARSEGYSKAELFASAHYLFTRKARSWFMEVNENNELRTWENLVRELKNEFLPVDIDFQYERMLHARRQGTRETFQDYYLDMVRIFRSMSYQWDDGRKFDALFRNTRDDCKIAMLAANIDTIPKMREFGKKFDAINGQGYVQKNDRFQGRPPARVEELQENDRWRDNRQQNRQKEYQNRSFKPKYKNEQNNRSSDQKNDSQRVGGGNNYYQKPQQQVFTNLCNRNEDTNPKPEDYPVRQGSPLKNLERPQAHSVSGLTAVLHQLGYSQMEAATEVDEISPLLVQLSGDARPFVKIQLMGIELIGLLDSGAARTVLGFGAKKLIKSLDLNLLPTSVNLQTASGDSLEVVGCADVPITFNGSTRILSVLFAPKLQRRCVLGYDFWLKFGISPNIPNQPLDILDDEIPSETDQEEKLTSEQIQQLEEVKKLFIVAAPGKLTKTHVIEHVIDLKDECKNLDPVRKNPYPWSPHIHAKVQRALDNLIRDDIVEPSESDWALPIIPVAKRDTSEVRLCLDARKLNERSKRDAYPLPHQDRILSHLGPVRFLTTIDLSQAFLQIPLNPKSRKYTAFSVPGRGLFQYKSCPMGLVGSPATLSKCMDRVLGHGALEPAIFVYLDDIVVATLTFEDHIAKLKELAKRLGEANLSINLQKSKFCCQELPYLGYILSKDGLRPNPDRIQAIIGYQVPKSVRQLRRFLGMVNYYRRFIENFSSIVAPLTDLLKNKPKRVQWNQAAELSFQAIKERLISAPVMANPNFAFPFVIQTDASDNAIAGVLTQTHDGEEKVIAFFSEKLKGAELRYHAAEKEGLAALRSIEKFRGYVEGSKFTLVTDSAALTFIMRAKWRSSSRLSRWSITLQQFDMDIRHRKGKDNIVPDALSRSIETLDAKSEDGWFSKLLSAVKADPEKYVDFRIVDGNLFKFVASKADTMDYRFEWKHCVPASARSEILHQEHNQNLHIGFDKCIEKIKRRYYWPRMSSDIKKYIAKCEICRIGAPTEAILFRGEGSLERPVGVPTTEAPLCWNATPPGTTIEVAISPRGFVSSSKGKVPNRLALVKEVGGKQCKV
ncbi:uncharacterized protein LOC129737691 [Uranotaenia lowii]|uniref:uncharacterized protein LOC129737691 n=1 Tax=Uranotaenia lowii TaxID=190385 RepID=UPI00247B12EF|nr:uncharacterized protein LOC129737691 [Uranotaenia lowii]